MNRRQTMATKTATTVVKEEEVLDVTNAAELSYLLSETVVALKVLLQEMLTVCCVCTEGFYKLRQDA